MIDQLLLWVELWATISVTDGYMYKPRRQG
jgi:hypothetical protein